MSRKFGPKRAGPPVYPQDVEYGGVSGDARYGENHVVGYSCPHHIPRVTLRGSPAFAFLVLRKGRQGIFKLDPRKKKAAIRKMWDLSKSTVRTPASPTMGPAIKRVDHIMTSSGESR